MQTANSDFASLSVLNTAYAYLRISISLFAARPRLEMVDYHVQSLFVVRYDFTGTAPSLKKLWGCAPPPASAACAINSILSLHKTIQRMSNVLYIRGKLSKLEYFLRIFPHPHERCLHLL